MRQRFEAGMHVRLHGRPEGSVGTLFYIHGLGESALGFEGIMEHPALEGWFHVAPDLQGYGKTPWRSEPLGLEELADSLAGWLRTRRSVPVVLLGHSMGGVIGQMLCERYPEGIRAFLNVEGNISEGDCTFSARAATYPLEDLLENGWREILDEVWAGGGEDEALRTYYPSIRLADPRQFHRNSAELVELSAAEGLAARMGALELPSRYLLGHPGGAGQRTRELLDEAGVSWKAIEPAGHWVHLDQPDRFVAEAADFLARLTPTSVRRRA